MDEFQDFKEPLLQYLRGIWKNRWIAVIIAWLLMLSGVFVVDQIKDRYVGETKLYLDSSTILKPLLKGLAIETDYEAIVQLMVRKLLSRPNLERAVRLTGMDSEVETPTEMEKLIDKVGGRIEIVAKKRTGVYSITYWDNDREGAKKMVQTLLDIFIEDALGKSSIESDSAIFFLDQQIEKYDQLLQQAEERREAFKRKNVGLMPQDGATYYGQLQKVNAELDEIAVTLSETIGRRDKLRTRLAEFVENQQVQGEMPSSNIYDESILQQEARLNDLLLLYTEEHPDVINARMILETLERRRQEQIKNPKARNRLDISDNPIYQGTEILLTKAEADISSLTARRNSIEKNKKEYSKLIEIVPGIEAELQRLNRDYEVHKANYNELVKRREKARISEDVESGTERVKFRVIEPPFVPETPNFPNRMLLDYGVLVFSLGCGYALSLLISLLQPVYYKSHDLRKLSEYIILGAIPKFETAKVVSNRHRNLVLFLTINLLLVGTLVAISYLHSKDILVVDSLRSMIL